MDEPDNVVVPFEEQPRPPEFDRAPPWAWALYDQQRRDRHHADVKLTKLGGEVREMSKKLGEEPDSDGKGGKGIIGDLRKLARDVTELMNLRTMGVGAVAAVALFGALIIAGIVHFIQGMGAAK